MNEPHITVTKPTRDDHDYKDEYYGPWRKLLCPHCETDRLPPSIPNITGVKRAKYEVVCFSCDETYVVEVVEEDTDS